MNKNLLIVLVFLLFNIGYGQVGTINTSTGVLASINTVYGKVSDSDTFLVYGTNIDQRIEVTPPLGFEVSKNGSIFTDTLIINTPTGGRGDIGATLIYIRLKGTIPAKTYGGVYFSLTSPNAEDVVVFMSPSTVNKGALTILADNKSKIYGDSNPDLTVSWSGFIFGDNVNSLTTPIKIETIADKASDAGIYNITVTGGESPNYIIYGYPGKLTIKKAPLTITTNDASKVYGSVNPNFTATYVGFVNGDNEAKLATKPTIATSADTTSPVGKYEITASGAVASNYEISYGQPRGSLTVTPAKLIITTNDASKVYGSVNPDFTATYVGFVNGDNETKLATKPTIAASADTTSPVGKYEITASGALSPNYEISYGQPSGFLTVTPAKLIITTSDASKVYGSVNPDFTATYVGFVNGDNETKLATKPTIAASADTTSPIGKYEITASGAFSSNYEISYGKPSGFLTVTPAKLIITTNDASKVYGSVSPDFTATYVGFVNGDTVANLTTQATIGTTAITTSSVGNYPITISGVTSLNYDIKFVFGTLTINKAALNITADSVVRTYGEVNPTFAASYAGIIDGETDANLIKSITFNTTAVATSSIGDYPITVSGVTSSNYDIKFVPGTLTINKATLTITADKITKTHGEKNPTLTVVYSGFVNGDTAPKLDQQVAINTEATTDSAIGDYRITVSGASSPNYNITFVDGILYVIASKDAGLSDIVISDGTLDKPFDTDKKDYTVEVPNETNTYVINPVPSNPNATVVMTVDGVIVDPANPLDLKVGDNEIKIVVTAEDGTTQEEYTVIVTRDPSHNSGLTDLAISEGTLSPAFAEGTTAYTATVPNDITSINVTPVTSDTTATVTINGVEVPSGTASAELPLQVGENTITTVVTAQDGTITTYTVVVTRDPSDNSGLTDLAISEGTLSPAFAEGTTAYTATVPNDITSINVTPVTSDTTATVTINGVEVPSGTASAELPLQVGENTITTVVTAQDGTITTYTVVITRDPSDNSGLTDLAISEGTLSPAFTEGTTAYTATVPNDVSNITVTPVTSDTTATITVNGIVVPSGTASADLPLQVGENTITTIVTAQDGTITTYTVVVTREASSNAGLSDIVISDGSLSPAFNSNTYEYRVEVPNEINSYVINPKTIDPTATVEMKVDGKVVAPTSPIDLNVGDNVITMVVTAADGTTQDTYTVIVTREEAPLSNNSGLTDLAISEGTLSPAFAEVTTAYTATVPNDVASITVTPVTADATETVTVNGVEVPSGTASAELPLQVGENTITTIVTAQDGTTTTYTVIVTREEAAASGNAGLSDIVISDGALSPAFNTDTDDYRVDVPNETNSIVITPITIDSAATVEMVVDGKVIDPTAPIDLKVGDNVVTIVVTAEDGTQETYIVIVNRADDVPAVLVPSNIITPNGDGNNDFWDIPGIDKYPKNSVKVFDRAARLVYSKDHYNNDWDGTYKGSPLAQDTYYYLIDLGSGLPKLKGFITIIRN